MLQWQLKSGPSCSMVDAEDPIKMLDPRLEQPRENELKNYEGEQPLVVFTWWSKRRPQRKKNGEDARETCTMQALADGFGGPPSAS
mmetsp:Transcript_19241/g.44776  ORF Transcript_19241/g.44776 Transcript_19241/m.44776 type:complete len:86 (-) Transcript_19241:1095-1352(-)